MATSNLIMNDINLKSDFINKFGDLSRPYNALNALGDQRHMWYYILTVITLVVSCMKKNFVLFHTHNNYKK